jgi:hypothetical protein
MTQNLRIIGWCSLVVLVALYVVGAVSHGSLRHEVQTLPLWVPIVAGFNSRGFSRWCALPCFLFWLLCMVLIWLFLLGWSHFLSGQFSPTEILLTVVIGIASAIGLVQCLWRLRWSWRHSTLLVLFAILQLACFRISMLPQIAHQ